MENKIEVNPRVEELIKDVIRDTTLTKQDVINWLLNEGYDNFFFNNTYEDLIEDFFEEYQKPSKCIKEAQYVQYVNDRSEAIKGVFSSFPKWLDDALYRGKVHRYYNCEIKINQIAVGEDNPQTLEPGDWICFQSNKKISFIKRDEFSRRDVYAQ